MKPSSRVWLASGKDSAGWPPHRLAAGARGCSRARSSALRITGKFGAHATPGRGQGFNLSLRDVERLATLISAEAESPAPFDSVERLSVLADMSRDDHEQTIGATSLLAEMLDSPSSNRCVASIALSALDLSVALSVVLRNSAWEGVSHVS